MTDYKLTSDTLVFTTGSSYGAQVKYYDCGYWYKLNHNGYEGLAEYLVSVILQYSNLENFVQYERCWINGRPGCRCKQFLQPDEKFVTFERLHVMTTGRSLTNTIFGIPGIAKREQYVIDFINDVLDFDVTRYLANILILDALTLNNDRHFNNLGVIVNENTNEVREAPIFDNGDSLFSSYAKFPKNNSIEENLRSSVAMPFSADAYAQAKELPFTLKLDYYGLKSFLNSLDDSRARSTLRYQLEHYCSVIPDNSNNNRPLKITL